MPLKYNEGRFVVYNADLRTRSIIVILLFTSLWLMPLRAEAHIFASPSSRIDFPYQGSTIYFVKASSKGESAIESILTWSGAGDIHSKAVDRFESEGENPPVIESVFLEDVNRDSVKDLLILVKWNVEHSALDTHGDIYRVHIYDGGSAKLSSNRLVRESNVEKLFPAGFHGTREGRKVKYKYRTASSIRKFLRSQ